jgi:HEAT repeat protein
MNCEQIDYILDGAAGETLDAAAKQSLDRHLAACDACRGGWIAYQQIAAVSVPRPPRNLRQRIVAALGEHSAVPARRPRPRVVVGSVALVAGLAAAAAIYFGYDDPEAATDAPDVAEMLTTDPSARDERASPPSSTVSADASATTADAAGAQGMVEPADTPALDPYSIVVLVQVQPEFARTQSPIDSQRADELAKCHQAVLQHLRAVAGLNVIGDERVAAFADSDASKEYIAQQLGAGSVMVVTPDNWCRATQYDSLTGAVRSGLMFGSAEPRADGWQSFAERVAAAVRDSTLRDRATVLAEARATVMNTALSDRERMSALFALNRPGADGRQISDILDEAVVAAAVQIGMTSSDAQARSGAWLGLRGVDDHYVLEPLLHALANDEDERVRQQAALALSTFLAEPGVKEALQRSAAEDPSHQATADCCIATVREAAQRASLTDDELVRWVRQTVLDDTLSARERLVPLAVTPDNRWVYVDELGDDAALAAFDLAARGSGNAGIRGVALEALARTREAAGSGAGNPELVARLLSVLATDEDEHVRAAAASVLRPYAGEPDVRAALERALTDSSAYVAQAAEYAWGAGARERGVRRCPPAPLDYVASRSYIGSHENGRSTRAQEPLERVHSSSPKRRGHSGNRSWPSRR